MFRFWKYDRQDSRKEWEKARAKRKLRKKEEEEQQVVGDDLVWQTVASVALLYHLGLLAERQAKMSH